MAVLNIQGREVTIDDAFLDLPLDQQNEQVEEIARSLGLTPEPQRNFGDNVLRQLGLTARAATEGAAGVIGLAYDPIAALINFGLDDASQIPSLTTQVRGLLERAGVPEPETMTERIVQAASQGLVGGGGGVALARGAGTVATGPIGQQVSRTLAAAPVGQLTGGAGAGLAGQTAEELGVGPAGQIAASILGGAVFDQPVALAERIARGRIPQEAQEIIQAGAREGVPVMTTDVIPPTTAAGGLAQQAGEKVPLIGTGGRRAAQAAARKEAGDRVVRSYSPELDTEYGEVVASLNRSALRTKNAAGKRLGEYETRILGDVDLSTSVKAIDDELAQQANPRQASDPGAVSALEEYRDIFRHGQTFRELKKNRTTFRERVSGETGFITTQGEEVTKRVERAMTKDLEKAVRTNFGEREASRWKQANAIYRREIDELKNTKLKNLLQRGELTPELVRSSIMSRNKSDAQRLYSVLDQSGRDSARASIIAEIVRRSGDPYAGASPARLRNELARAKDNLGVFFKGEDAKRLDGLTKLLTATGRADRAAATTPTGQETLPYLVGAGAVLNPNTLIPIIGGGAFARIYESAPVRNALLRLSDAKRGTSAYDTAAREAYLAIMRGSQAVDQPLELTITPQDIPPRM